MINNLFKNSNSLKTCGAFSIALLLTSGSLTHANDSAAAMAAGGLELKQTEQIAMRSEDLFISKEKVEVKYVFVNNSSEDISTIVAFPMPDLEYTESSIFIPSEDNENFMAFSVSVDGHVLKPELEAKAFVDGQDITQRLKSLGIPLHPMTQATTDALTSLKTEDKAALVSDKIIYDEDFYPAWTLKSTYYWTQTFPANKTINVEHRYSPSIGGTSVSEFITEQGPSQESIEHFCADNAFRSAAKNHKKKNSFFHEIWIEYILVTGANWAGGTIGDFRLVIDKGDAKNLVSFCMDGVKKISPTQFEVRKTNFKPEQNLNIVILEPSEINE